MILKILSIFLLCFLNINVARVAEAVANAVAKAARETGVAKS